MVPRNSPVEHQEEALPTPEKMPAAKHWKPMPMLCIVEAEHLPVAVGVAAADRPGPVAVHGVELSPGPRRAGEDQAGVATAGPADREQRHREDGRRDQHLGALGAHRRGKSTRAGGPGAACRSLAAIDQLVAARVSASSRSIGRPDRSAPRRARGARRRRGTGREAGATMRPDRLAARRRPRAAPRLRQQGLRAPARRRASRLELARRHRWPSSQWATPAARRRARRPAPAARRRRGDRASSSRAGVSRGARAGPGDHRGLRARRQGQRRRGAAAGQRAMQARGAWTTSVPAARSPRRLKSCRTAWRGRRRHRTRAGSRRRAAGCARSRRPA